MMEALFAVQHVLFVVACGLCVVGIIAYWTGDLP